MKYSLIPFFKPSNRYLQGDDKEKPLDAVILDWQMTSIHSPVLDLCHFIYCVASEKELNRLDELLRCYHKALSESIMEMGSDPENLFPFKTLLDHWKRFSAYGLTIPIAYMELLYLEESDGTYPDFASPDIINQVANIKLKNQERNLKCQNRLIALLKHQYKSNFL